MTHGDSFIVVFPRFDGEPEDLPKATIMEVEIFRDGSIVYKADGCTTVEVPKFGQSPRVKANEAD